MREDEEVLTIVQFGSRLSTSQSWKYALFCTRFIQVAYTRLSVGKFTAARILSVVDSSGGCSISIKVTLPCTAISRSTQNSLIVGFVVPLWNGKKKHSCKIQWRVGTNNDKITEENKRKKVHLPIKKKKRRRRVQSIRPNKVKLILLFYIGLIHK